MFQPFNWTFALTFLSPLVIFLGVAFGYGTYAVYYGSRVAGGSPRWSEHKENLLRDLAYTAGIALVVKSAFYTEAVFFYLQHSWQRLVA